MVYGYQGVLELGDETIQLDNCSYSYVRDINEKTGEIQSLVLNGIVYASYSACPSNDVLNWALKYKFKDVKFRLQQTDSDKGSFIPEADVTLQDAACVGIKLNYNRSGNTHFNTQLTITANESVVGDTQDWVKKNWLLNE